MTRDEEYPLSWGRRAKFSMVQDWVLTADISPQAKCLFAVYSMHLNHKRKDRRVWPTRRSLAALMGFDKVASVDRYNRELVELGAIEVHRRSSKSGGQLANLVIVHEIPPDGYAGPQDLKDFYRNLREDQTPSGQVILGPPQPPGGGWGDPPDEGSGDPPPGGSEPEEVQPEEDQTKARSGVAQPQNVDPPSSETIENKDDCLPRPHTTETTQSIEKVDGPLTRQDQNTSDLQKHAPAVATLPCAAAPPLRDGLPPNPVPPRGTP